MMNIFLASIAIPTQYFDKTVSFYRDILGFKVLLQTESQAALRANDLGLIIYFIDPSNEFFPTGHGIYINLHIDNISQVRERLSATGTTIQNGKENPLLLADPNGNLIKLIGSDADNKKKQQELAILIIGAVVSYISSLSLNMKKLDSYLTFSDISDELRIEIESLQAKLIKMLESGRDLQYEASGVDEQNYMERAQAFRAEFMELTPDFYKFIAAVAKLTTALYEQEIHDFMVRIKLILDEIPMIPR